MANTTELFEVWQNISPGDVYLTIRDSDGYNTRHRVAAGASFEIPTKERKRLSAPNPQSNVFVAGRLRRIDEDAEPDQAGRGYTEAELRDVITNFVGADFEEWVRTEQELHVRRLYSIMRAERLGTVAQVDSIKIVIEERWPAPTYSREQQELRAAGTFKVRT